MGSRSKSVAVNAGRVHHKIYLWCQRNIRVVKHTARKKSARFCKRRFEKKIIILVGNTHKPKNLYWGDHLRWNVCPILEDSGRWIPKSNLALGKIGLAKIKTVMFQIGWTGVDYKKMWKTQTKQMRKNQKQILSPTRELKTFQMKKQEEGVGFPLIQFSGIACQLAT